MALLGKEVGREETTNYCPCVGPETFNTSHTQKGLKLGRKLANANVAYVFHPDHSFSKTKSKEVSCGEKTLSQRWWAKGGNLEHLWASKCLEPAGEMGVGGDKRNYMSQPKGAGCASRNMGTSMARSLTIIPEKL